MNARRTDARERMQRVRAILLSDWDPLVGNNPNLADEYDTYVPRVMRAVEGGASEREISDLLLDCEEDLGVPSPVRTACDKAAAALVAAQARAV